MVRLTGLITLVCVLVVGTATGASAEEVTLGAVLSNANVVGGGAVGTSGTASIIADTDTGELCFDVAIADIDAPTAAHIHLGPPGTNGGVVVDLEWSTTKGTGCVIASIDTVSSIVNVPSAYYVNVHTEEFPGGATRGNLRVTNPLPVLAFTGTNTTALLSIAGAVMVGGGVMLIRVAPRRSESG